jgi:hypothetical protein
MTGKENEIKYEKQRGHDLRKRERHEKGIWSREEKGK